MPNYNPIQYATPGTPAENSDRVRQLLAQDFDAVRNRTDEQCTLVGRFMSAVLLIEAKLVRLLEKFDPDIDDKMLGRKLGVFKDFLDEANLEDNGLDINDYRALLGPLNEIKTIRNGMAHNLRKVDIEIRELRETLAFVQRELPDMSNFHDCESENLKCIGVVFVFAFVFCSKTAFLQMIIA